MKRLVRIASYLSLRLVLISMLLVVVAGCSGGLSQVPLRRVVLYQNGIGYFERSGEVDGDELRLRFQPHEADDALKTLIVVERQQGDGQTPLAVSAVVPQPSPVERDGEEEGEEADRERTVGLSVKLSRPPMGELFIAYAIPTPTWRAVYRVVLPEDQGSGQGLFQAFALINNVSDEDWNDVELVLATGAPFTYAVDLRTPRFVPRPDVTGRLIEPALVGAVQSEASRRRAEAGIEEDIPDTDHDGIVGDDDYCPNEPEVYNGLDDDDGCPDRGRVEVVGSNIVILDKVYFTHNSGEIREISHPILDAIVATLEGNPQITNVDVEGHTADNEDDPWGLAAERAGAVRNYLVSGGVDESRLVVSPYGYTRPVDPGESSSARERNRRVEFRIRRTTAGPVDPEAVEDEPVTARALEQSVGTTAQATETSEGTDYRIEQHVTVPAGSSTLVPLVNRPLNIEEVLLFRPDGSARGSDVHPLRAARIENSTGLDLVTGPLSLFSGGSFIGEGLLGRSHTGDTTFVPFSVDESTWVVSSASSRVEPHRVIGLARGVLVVEDIRARRTQYRLNVGRRTPARVFLRHLPTPNYEPQDLPPGTEETVDGLLIPLPIAPGRTSSFTVVEHRAERRRIHLLEDRRTLITAYLYSSEIDEMASQGLRRIIELRDQLRELEEQLDDLREQLGDVGTETADIRSSLAATQDNRRATADLRRRLLERLEQNTTRRNELTSRLGENTTRRSTLRAELSETLRDITIEDPHSADH